MIGALIGLALAGAVATDLDEPALTDFVASHSPNGFDVTLDGTIWINIAPVGQTEDYAVRATDLREASLSPYVKKYKFWIRGYFKRNPKVSYRETKSLMYIDCASETLRVDTTAYYDATGKMLWRDAAGGYAGEPIIPGTYGAHYQKLFCRK